MVTESVLPQLSINYSKLVCAPPAANLRLQKPKVFERYHIQQERIHTNHGVPGISPSKANNHNNKHSSIAPNSRCTCSRNTYYPQPPILIPSPYPAGPCNYCFRFANSSCAPHLCPEPVPWRHRHRNTG